MKEITERTKKKNARGGSRPNGGCRGSGLGERKE